MNQQKPGSDEEPGFLYNIFGINSMNAGASA